MEVAGFREAVRALRGGGAAAFPTDTVFGLGVAVAPADAASDAAAGGGDAVTNALGCPGEFAETCARDSSALDGGVGKAGASPGDPLEVLYRLKGRDRGKPVAWLVGKAGDLQVYGRDVPAYALELAERFWPGPLTLVVRASDAVPAAFQSDEGTIGLRMPDSAVALGLIDAVGCPVATTSANLSGCDPAARSGDVDTALASQVPVVGDGSDRPSGVSSTVVLCTGPEPRVLRQGSARI